MQWPIEQNLAARPEALSLVLLYVQKVSNGPIEEGGDMELF